MIYPMADLENKLREGKNARVVFDFQKILTTENKIKKNDFLMFSCLIKKI